MQQWLPYLHTIQAVKRLEVIIPWVQTSPISLILETPPYKEPTWLSHPEEVTGDAEQQKKKKKIKILITSYIVC